MERMLNARLERSLQSQDLLTEIQCGFRKNRSTLDHLVRFETLIRDAPVQKQHLLAIFFDLEKAYGTTWKHTGDGCSSGQHPISCSLQVLKGTDDCAMCMWGKSVQRVERTMQFGVNSIQNWASENGFKFSRSKTVCIHVCSHNVFFPRTHNYQRSKIPWSDFLLQTYLKKHIQHLNGWYQNTLDSLRVIGHTYWGADRTVLLYRNWFVPYWITGPFFMGRYEKYLLKQLDPIHHQGLRINWGSFCTSSVQSLYVEAHDPSLSSRRLKLSLNYFALTFQLYFEPQNAKLFKVSIRLSSRRPPDASAFGEFRVRSRCIWYFGLGHCPLDSFCTNRSFSSNPV